MPKQAVKTAKLLILNCIGIALAGSTHPIVKILKEYVEDLGGRAQSKVIGLHLKTTCQTAALVNGTLAHVLDYDDVIGRLMLHLTAPVLPAVLAIGEMIEANGKNVLTAFIIGSEMECRLCAGLNPWAHRKGWHTSGIIGALGATAAAGKLLGLDTKELMNAFSIACSEASGIRENFGTMVKPYHIGLASENGVRAVLLAKKDFKGTEKALEGQFGFFNVFVGEYRLEDIIKNLGDLYQILNFGISFKKYPSCSITHAALDAVLEIVKQHDVKADDVVAIECGTTPLAPETLVHSRPRNSLEAKFSMQFCLAVAILEKQVSLDQFVDEKVNDPRIIELMEKVKLYVDPALTQEKGYASNSAKVKVKLKDGREYAKRVDEAKGTPANPISRNELIEKYKNCAKRVLSEEAVKESIHLITNFEKIENINALMNLL